MIEVKSAWINTLRSIVSFAASFIFALLIFRFASAEEIGKYYFWASIVVFGGIVFNAPSATLHYILPKKRGEEALSLPSTVLLAMFPLAVLLFTAVLSLLGFEDSLTYGMMAAVASVFGQSGGYLFSGFNLEKSLAATLLSNIGRIAMILWAAFGPGLNFFWLASAASLAGALQAVFFIPSMVKALNLKNILKAAMEIRQNIGDGIVYYLMNLLSSVMLWADVAFLGIFMGAEAVGVYNAVGNLMKYVLAAIPGSISFFILPLVVKTGGGKKILRKGIVLLTFLLGPLIISASYPFPFVKIITGGYEEFASLGFYFLPAMLVLPVQALYTQYLLGKRDKRIVLFLSAATALNIALNYLLGVVAGFGMEGVAFSSSISSLAYTLFLLKESKMERGYAVRSVLQMLLVGSLLFLIFQGMPKTFSNEMDALEYALMGGVAAFFINVVATYLNYNEEFVSTARILFRKA